MRKIANKLKRVKFYLFRTWVNIYAKTHKYSTYIGIVSCNTWKNKVYEDVSINIEEALSVWKDTLEDVFPTKVTKETDKVMGLILSPTKKKMIIVNIKP